MNKLCERACSERAWKLFPFSHSKTAISFSILLVYFWYFISETHIFSGLKSHLHMYIQSMQFPVITYCMALYVNDSYVYRQNTNIEKIYVSRLENFSHTYILKLLFLSIFCWYFRYFVGTNEMLVTVGLHVATNFEMYRQNSEKALLGGGGELPPAVPPPPPATLMAGNAKEADIWFGRESAREARGKFKDLVCLVRFYVELNALYYFHCV